MNDEMWKSGQPERKEPSCFRASAISRLTEANEKLEKRVEDATDKNSWIVIARNLRAESLAKDSEIAGLEAERDELRESWQAARDLALRVEAERDTWKARVEKVTNHLAGKVTECSFYRDQIDTWKARAEKAEGE